MAWCEHNTIIETVAYDLMSVCYYNTSDMKKADFYNTRYLRGVTES